MSKLYIAYSDRSVLHEEEIEGMKEGEDYLERFGDGTFQDDWAREEGYMFGHVFQENVLGNGSLDYLMVYQLEKGDE